MDLARAMLSHRYGEELTGSNKVRGIWERKGDVFIWQGGKWILVDLDWLRFDLWEGLSHVYMDEQTEHSQTTTRKPVRQAMVSEVCEAIRSRIQFRWDNSPVWFNRPAGASAAEWCVAYQDVVVDIKRTIESSPNAHAGQFNWVTYERDANYFTLSVIPAEFKPDEEAPVWDRCMSEWFVGSDSALEIELRERAYGYALLPAQPFDMCFVEQGSSGGGKGTGVRLLHKALGDVAYFGSSFRALGDGFGLDGIQDAKVLVVEEAQDMKGGRGGTVAAVLKDLIGGAAQKIDIKNQRVFSKRTKVMVILQSNPPVRLPDDNRGLSSKIKWLPYEVSFRGKEDPDLDDKLFEEVGPASIRWVKAMIRLFREPQTQNRFTMSEKGNKRLREFEVGDNVWDMFLEANFTRDPTGLIKKNELRNQMRRWEEKTGEIFLSPRKRKVTDTFLVAQLLSYTTWSLREVRRGDRYIRGLARAKKLENQE